VILGQALLTVFLKILAEQAKLLQIVQIGVGTVETREYIEDDA
jgi:hypothetical protein